jgi:tetrapyrrole methylase family protein/MazG family protein
MTVHIVGLGPGRSGLLTAEVARLLERLPVLLRTRHHPTVAELDPLGRWESFDDAYARLDAFETVYEAICEGVTRAARNGDVVYAVPGHPLVAERSVSRLQAQLTRKAIPFVVYPGVSYADAAAVALGMDLGSIQLCDGLELRIDAQRPALITQVFDRDAATALKLRLLDVYPAEHPVTILTALGGPDESKRYVELAQLDHRAFSYLDTVFVPALPAFEDLRRLDGLLAIVNRLHAPDGCPWDREQTHESLRSHLLEECYEALEAIDSGDPQRLVEELGDVLLQVLMHAAVGERAETFSVGDVTRGIAAKLIHRHPHVFGDGTATTADEVAANWEQLKAREKPKESVLDGVPATFPALAAAQTMQRRARRLGFDWPTSDGPLEKLAEEIGEFARAEGAVDRADEFGDILYVVALIGQRLGIDAEQALRGANSKFKRRFAEIERLARARAVPGASLDFSGLWSEVKTAEAARRL